MSFLFGANLLLPLNRKTGKLGSQLLVLLLCFNLVSPLALAKNMMKAFDFDGLAQNKATLAADYVESKSPKLGTFSRKESVNGKTKVGVVGFQVVFAENTSEYVEGSTLRGITQGNFMDNRWQLDVLNLTPDIRQRITNQMYETFQKQLQDAGFEVVPQESIVTNPHYQALVQETTQNPKVLNQTQRLFQYGKNNVWSVVPVGFPIETIDYSSDIFKGATPGFLGGFAGTANAFGKAGRLADIGEGIQDFTEFTPIAITYFLDFKKLSTVGGLITNPFGSNSKDSTFGLSSSEGSYLRFYSKAGKGGSNREKRYAANYQLNFVLKKPVQTIEPVGRIHFEGENFGTQVFTSTASLMLKSMGGPGIKTPTRVRKYQISVDPATYTAHSFKVLEAASELLLTAASKAVSPNTATEANK